MHICFLAGANSIHSKRWVEFFAQRGHRVSWISLGVGETLVCEGFDFFNVEKTGPRILRPLYYYSQIREILKRQKPDVLHVHQLWLDGVIAAFSRQHPFVITPWGSDILLLKNKPIQKKLTRYAISKADFATCDGDNTREALVNFGMSPDKIEKIMFGVDVDLYQPRQKPEVLKKKLGITDGPIVVSLRSLKPLYDVATFIRSMPSVLKEVPNAVFVVVGDGPQRGELENLAKELGVYDSIKFVGAVEAHEIPQYLNLADIYVSTSLSDSGLAASTAEAMSSGVPVIVTDSGDNTLWIEEGQNGYVVGLSDYKALASHTIQLLFDEVLRMNIGQNNRDMIDKKNNYDREMKKMEKTYLSLLNR